MEENKTLTEVLEKLYGKLEVPEELDMETKESFLEDFWNYYHAKRRHHYHEVTLFILKKEGIMTSSDMEQLDLFSKAIKDFVDFALEMGSKCQNKDSIRDCETKGAYKCNFSDGKKCYFLSIAGSLDKLHDHILLEMTRLSEIRAANVEFRTELADAKSDLGNLNKKANDLDEKAEKTQSRIENTQKEYITILGIFASVVLAFIGGMVFSTSVLQNIGNGSIYRILTAVLVIAFTFLNMLFILVRFISEINSLDNNKIKYPNYMKWINVSLLILFCVIALCWFVDVQILAENFRNWIHKR